jgi:murein DD-endopeptidase MepM/ murein hydrolase activator NlpD
MRPAAIAALVVAALVAVAALGPARAQVLGPGPSTTTTTPPPDGSTTTTSAPPSTLLPGTTTTTTAPPPSEGQTGPPPSNPAPPPAGEGGGDGVVPPGTPQVVPPGFQGLINSVKRSRANNTSKLLMAIQPLIDAGLSEEEAIAIGFGRFPVAGQANFSHDWWFPRFTPVFHLHEGTDIFAAAGTPVRSPAAGVLRQANGPVGGLAAYVTADDGSYYYMAHLAGYPPDQQTGQRVEVGDIVGFNGDSGNAQGGSPHVHFEVHPAPTKTVTTGRGKNKVTKVVTTPVRPGAVLPPADPKPYLDLWINEAIANVPNLLAELEANKPRVIVATGLTRQFADGRGGVFAAPTTPSRDQLLWASSASPSGGALQLAQAEAATAAQSLDWKLLARRAAGRADEWARADENATAAAALVTPAALRRFLEWETGQR